MSNPHSSANSRSRIEPCREKGLLRDVLWGRPVFKAPPLINPQVVFDPLPYRALLPPDRRKHAPWACRPLHAA